MVDSGDFISQEYLFMDAQWTKIHMLLTVITSGSQSKFELEQ